MYLSAKATSLAITNPLVRYRALLATSQLVPDPDQHRLAVFLQKLYERLKDYEPTGDYRHRLAHLGRTIQNGPLSSAQTDRSTPIVQRGVWTSLLAEKERRNSLALTKTLSSHEEALHLDTPKGLMLHGDVGVGKSMLIDLFIDSLPMKSKQRWHFSTFMLDVIRRLEQLRTARAEIGVAGHVTEEYSILCVARDLVKESAILFLDEFQLPDRAASKIITNLMTAFFQLGGVLIATSNRMPEELAKAAGVEFVPSPSRFQSLAWKIGIASRTDPTSAAARYPRSDFADFLDLLRARCDVWEINGARDYRRQIVAELPSTAKGSITPSHHTPKSNADSDCAISAVTGGLPPFYHVDRTLEKAGDSVWEGRQEFDRTVRQVLRIPSTTSTDIPWEQTSLRVYGRVVPVTRHLRGVTCWTFEELCGSCLGPADYLTLASTFHTVILVNIPVLSLRMKHEARRFITLIDALYETRCRLIISAAVGPDELFFPEENVTSLQTSNSSSGVYSNGASDSYEYLSASDDSSDAMSAETFSEAFQDASAPFRPNISSYSLSPDALEDDPPNRARPALGGSESWTEDLGRWRPIRGHELDFSQSSAFTGEDERFAYKRAESRLWEMCGARWWGKEGRELEVEESWRPLSPRLRSWEGSVSKGRSEDISGPNDRHLDTAQGDVAAAEAAARGTDSDAGIYKHGASPFRTHPEPPPKFNWTHAWGTVRWGKRAGNWGEGVEGVPARRARGKG